MTGAKWTLPAPPPWYVKFQTDEDISGIPPPPIPSDPYPMFGGAQGNPLVMGDSASLCPNLEHGDALFEDQRDNSGKLMDYRLQFQELLSTFERHPLPQTSSSILQDIVKLNKNMQYCLNRLREWEALDNIVEMMVNEYNERMKLITESKSLLTRIDSFSGSL
eukprot:GHVH01006958.1.p1 GENE.GHVH01006958.1~~GHVH01006958.1.p1  ORF type:complete len:163 (+),score=25.17 GHVH01006958.1:48-536(+)